MSWLLLHCCLRYACTTQGRYAVADESSFVPRSSEAFATSWLIGLGAALFSLGLPVRSISCIRRKQVLELATLDKDPLDTIAELGEEDAPSDAANGTTQKAPKHTLEDLQQWTRPDAPHKYMRDFARIRKAVDSYAERWHWWHVPALLIAAAQGCIFGFAIEPLLKAAGIPKFIFACAGVNWTGLYLSVSAIANALLRLAMWQLCDHEIVNSKQTLLRLGWSQSADMCASLSSHGCCEGRARRHQEAEYADNGDPTPASLSTPDLQIPYQLWPAGTANHP